jgi:uncharacterized protein
LHLIVVAAGICAAAAILRPDPANAQSFDCRQVRNQDEMLICREPDLARLDQQLATLYREQLGKIPKERQDDFQRHENHFLNARRRCGEHHSCIEQSYRNRIKELEDFVSEAQREEHGVAAPDLGSEPRDRPSTRSERPVEPSGSSSATAPATSPQEPRAEGEIGGAAGNPAALPEPQLTETPHKTTGKPEHRIRHSRDTDSAPPSASASGSSTEQPAPDRQATTNDALEKPTIKWVDSAPTR